MIIRLSGGEKKPKSRLSVLELSTRKIRFEKDFKKIRNAEMGISPARQMRSENLCLRILSGNRAHARVKQMTGLRYLFPWLRAKRGNTFQENPAIGFTKSQSSFPMDLHFAEQPGYEAMGEDWEQRRVEAQKLLSNLVPPPASQAAER